MRDVREPTHGWAEHRLECTASNPLLPDLWENVSKLFRHPVPSSMQSR